MQGSPRFMRRSGTGWAIAAAITVGSTTAGCGSEHRDVATALTPAPAPEPEPEPAPESAPEPAPAATFDLARFDAAVWQ